MALRSGESPPCTGNLFLEYGGRFYPDTGCHPEYAAPECASPRQSVVYDRPGERALEDLQNCAEEKIHGWAPRGILPGLWLPTIPWVT